MSIRPSPALILLAALVSPVQAQNVGVYVDIGPCMAMTSDTERYNCYDLLEEQIRAAQTRDTELPRVSIQRNTRQQADTAADEVAEQSSPVSEFGRETAATANSREANARVLENEEGEQELVDIIASLEERVPNQWEITLASGQVWYQLNSKRFRLREGMQVRIYPSPFGSSYRLSATNLNGFIQVRRIQ